MKNHTAIIGRFDVTVNVSNVTVNRGGTTTFSGDIGIPNSTNDNTIHVFSHNGVLDNALLYGVTISGVRADGNFPSQSGGGMYNSSSSPRLFNVVFSDNSAPPIHGGGMYNKTKPPKLSKKV